MAEAGCRINLSVKNTGSAKIYVDHWNSKVKSKGGLWKKLGSGDWRGDYVNGGATHSSVYNGTFNCGSKRRYQIQYKCMSGAKAGQTFVKYYPSSKTWSTAQTLTIPLGSCG